MNRQPLLHENNQLSIAGSFQAEFGWSSVKGAALSIYIPALRWGLDCMASTSIIWRYNNIEHHIYHPENVFFKSKI